MTKIVTIEGHRVKLLKGMTFHKASHTLPGDFDEITYRNASIAVEDGDATRYYRGLYKGTYYVIYDGGREDFFCRSLDVAKRRIDKLADRDALISKNMKAAVKLAPRSQRRDVRELLADLAAHEALSHRWDAKRMLRVVQQCLSV